MSTTRHVRGTLVGAVAGLVLLTGCSGGSSPDLERREALNAVVSAANERDADRMRSAVDELVAVLNRQSGSDLPADEVMRISAAAAKVKVDADLIDPQVQGLTEAEKRAAEAERMLAEQQASATPSPEPSPSPTPSPTPSPSASPSPSADPGNNGNGNGRSQEPDDG